VPIITDFIRNTTREFFDKKLEDALEMPDLEWSKDNDTNFGHQLRTQCNRLSTSQLFCLAHFLGEVYSTSPGKCHDVSNKNGPARVKRRMQCEAAAPSKPLAVMTLCFCQNEKCMQKSA